MKLFFLIINIIVLLIIAKYRKKISKKFKLILYADKKSFHKNESYFIEKGKLRAVYRSPTFPTTGYGHAHNLHPELTAKIKTAFFTWEFDSDPLYKKEFAKADKFIGIRHMNDWAVIRQIDTANGVSYDCK